MVDYKNIGYIVLQTVRSFLNAHMLLLRPILTICRCRKHDMQKGLHIIGRCDAENYFFHCHSMPLFVLESVIKKAQHHTQRNKHVHCTSEPGNIPSHSLRIGKTIR